MRAFFSAEQLVIEGAASVGLAVLLAQKLDVSGQNVVLVVTGRNINSQQFLSIINKEGISNRWVENETSKDEPVSHHLP